MSALSSHGFHSSPNLDAHLDQPVDFHCIGGFVVSQHYGFGRETADLDVLSVLPKEAANRSLRLRKGSLLQKKHHVYIDHVRVTNHPDGYERRLARVFTVWSKVRLLALEPHDLALTKLERSAERDIRLYFDGVTAQRRRPRFTRSALIFSSGIPFPFSTRF